MAYRRYFVTTGKGESDTSKLNAFDRALMDAGIGQCNLVQVSSILPPNATETKPVEIPPGTITHCVLARRDGAQGDTISAGIAWAKLNNYGIVAEDNGPYDEQTTKQNLTQKITEMASARNQQPQNTKHKTAAQTVGKKHGTTIAALIYVE